jgi:hypothetical protein
MGGLPWRDVSGIFYDCCIISHMFYISPCRISQVWARGMAKKDISMLRLKVVSKS